MYKILLLEDDAMLSETIKSLLEMEGYELFLCKNANEAIDATYDKKFDLYLFDINVPFGNGIDLLKDLREAGDKTPAFFITALKDIKSVSKGFDAGCDDYIKKPFDFDELIIRIEAILKKYNPYLKFGDIEYSFDEDVVLVNGKELDMGEVSKNILLLFLKNINRIVHKEAIYDVMQKPTDVALRVQINKLKKELGLNIINIRGVGYKLEKL